MEIPWVIGEQTKIKHELLRSYIEKWACILFNNQKNYGLEEHVLYFDGFSGPGTYWTDDTRKAMCPGSPVIVAEIANKLLDAKPSRKFTMICLDKKKECIEPLQRELIRRNKHNQIWLTQQAPFDETVNLFSDKIEKKDKKVPPMFFFIDPSGYSNYPMTTLKRILTHKRSELFINFMIYDIIRFWRENEERMEEQFGCCVDFERATSGRSPEEKGIYFKNLYCNQLKKVAQAKHVMPFRINTPGQSRRVRYYMIHASNNPTALRVMKDSMASISDSPYRFEAIGIEKGQTSLFEDPDKINLKDQILAYCKNYYPRHLDYEHIEQWAYDNTNGVSKTIKPAVIELENGKLLTVIRKPRQRKSTITKGARITYRGHPDD